MTARATFKQADLNRAVKAAVKRGWKVEIEGAKITLLPPGAETASSPANDAERRMREAFGE